MCYIREKDMLNVRLSEETEKELLQYCELEGLTKTDVVKEALVAYLSEKRKSKSAYEAGSDLFGLEGSGNNDASTTYKQKVKQKLHAKHSH